MNDKTLGFDSFIYNLVYFKSDFLTMFYKFITEFASIFIIENYIFIKNFLKDLNYTAEEESNDD